MSYTTLSIEHIGHIAHLSLCRPDELNTMTVDFWHEFPAAIKEINEHSTARAIVISSTGKHFCAGMDLKVFSNPDNFPSKGDPARLAENLRRVVMQLQETFNVLESARMPVLTAIQGGCIGGAVDLVCASDCRYATSDSYFTIAETNIGMTADLGTMQRLPHLIPQGLMRELAYTGRKLMADEALSIGLVNRVFDDHDALINGVLEIAESIAQKSPLAITGCKEMINYARDHTIEDSLKYMAAWQSGMFRQEDLMRSFMAKQQKAVPEYQDLWPIKPVFNSE